MPSHESSHILHFAGQSSFAVRLRLDLARSVDLQVRSSGDLLIRVHSAFVELPQEAFRQVPLRGS